MDVLEILGSPGEEPGPQEPCLILEKGGARKKAVPYEEGAPFVGWPGGGGSDGGCRAIPEGVAGGAETERMERPFQRQTTGLGARGGNSQD